MRTGKYNDQMWLNNSHMLDEWFWAKFEPIPIFINLIYNLFFLRIRANNDHVWILHGQVNDVE